MMRRHLPHENPNDSHHHKLQHSEHPETLQGQIGSQDGPASAGHTAALKIQELYRARSAHKTDTAEHLHLLLIIPALRRELIKLRSRVHELEKTINTTKESKSDVDVIESRELSSSPFFNDDDGDLQRCHIELASMNKGGEDSRELPSSMMMYNEVKMVIADNKKDADLQNSIEIEPSLKYFEDNSKEIIIDDGYELQGSMWDVSLILWSSGLSTGCSVYGTFLLLMNTVIQLFFSVILLKSFINRVIDQNVILGFRDWRRGVGHLADNVNHAGVSLVERLCEGDPSLQSSAYQAQWHSLMDGYLLGLGSSMCVVTLVLFFMCFSKELTDLASFVRAVLALPRGAVTVFKRDDGNGHQIVSINSRRCAIVLSVQLCRFFVAVILAYAGTMWLVNTASVADLILNAVALECIMTIDEIIFEALAPLRLRSYLDTFTTPLPLPPLKQWKGLDYQSLATLFFLLLYLAVLIPFQILPTHEYIELAHRALCAGERNFVYTVSQSGIPVWAPSSAYSRFDAPTKSNSDGVETFLNNGLKLKSERYAELWDLNNKANIDWMRVVDVATMKKLDDDRMNFRSKTVDRLISKWGGMKNVTKCGDDVIYYFSNQTAEAVPPSSGVCYNDKCTLDICLAEPYSLIDQHRHKVPKLTEEQTACCVAQQVKSSSIEGGRFSIDGFNMETTSTALDVWNPGCQDMMGWQAPTGRRTTKWVFEFNNLFAGSFGDSLGSKACGMCPASAPYCDPELSICTNISCTLVESYCYDESIVGLRARQFCPQTCGCDDPNGKQVLVDPEYGCPSNCLSTQDYLENAAEKSCEDEDVDSDFIQDYVLALGSASEFWPLYWKNLYHDHFQKFFRWNGCAAIDYALTNKDWNFCAPGGTPFPVKPLTYMCPVTCGCSEAWIEGCPTACNSTDT